MGMLVYCPGPVLYGLPGMGLGYASVALLPVLEVSCTESGGYGRIDGQLDAGE